MLTPEQLNEIERRLVTDQDDDADALARHAREDVPALLADAAYWRRSCDGYKAEIERLGTWNETFIEQLGQAEADRDRARDMVAALEAENARVRELHSEFRTYDDCGHRHAEGDEGVREIDEVGLVCEDGFMYSVCRECCTDGSGYQTEECASAHDHPGWLCATNTILRAAEAGGDA